MAKGAAFRNRAEAHRRLAKGSTLEKTADACELAEFPCS
jgi:hypothetical protein